MNLKMSDLNLIKVLEYIKTKYEEFNRSELRSFREFLDENFKVKKDILRFRGFYVIYHKDNPIYVGVAGKGKHYLAYRVADLFFDYTGRDGKRKFKHTLTKNFWNVKTSKLLMILGTSTLKNASFA